VGLGEGDGEDEAVGEGEAAGVGEGVSVGEGIGIGLADAVAVGVADGVGTGGGVAQPASTRVRARPIATIFPRSISHLAVAWANIMRPL
jgi:hypothetical protein